MTGVGTPPPARPDHHEPDQFVGSMPDDAVHRHAYVDNLKVILVIGVIVGHTMMAWTGIGTWVFDEPPVREPMLSILSLFLIGSFFGMAVFFAIAGMFTPPSLARKGLRRFLSHRALRLGFPLLFFVLALSPFVEYVDPDNAGWDRGFGSFVLEIWWPPVPGPTWFLGVLLVFSTMYALARSIWRRHQNVSAPPPPRYLAMAVALATVATYLVRLATPLGEELWHLAIGQAPGWVIGFSIGILGAERGWFDPINPTIVRVARTAGVIAIALSATVLIGAGVTGADLKVFAGGGTLQSFVVSMLEGTLVVTMPLWLLDAFRRRYNRQGRVARVMSRSAFAAFVLHQLVLVGLVLASREVTWPPEVEFLLVSALGVVGSFGLGALALRLPGISRIV
jgi:hypothetical protein